MKSSEHTHTHTYNRVSEICTQMDVFTDGYRRKCVVYAAENSEIVKGKSKTKKKNYNSIISIVERFNVNRTVL